MFNNITKKVVLSIILWIFVWIGIFISYAIDITSLSQIINDWDVIKTDWFNQVKNRLVNINDSWIYTWSIVPTQISAWTAWISITGNAATASGVPWTWVTSRPTDLWDFTNIAWYIKNADITDNRVNTTGDNINWNLNVSGNVWIGTTIPWYKLDVVGITNVGYLIIDPYDSTNEWGEISLVWAWTNWSIQIDNYAGNARIFTLADWKQFQILGWSIYANGTANNYFSGNVGIGTNTPSQKLHVEWAIKSAWSYVINNTAPTIYFQDTDHRSAMIHTNSNYFYILRWDWTNSTTRATVLWRWPLTINLENNNATFWWDVYANAFIYNSDKRLKYYITPLGKDAKNILNISSVRFKWKENNKNDIWIIAQDVEKFFPEFVKTDERWYKSVDYPKLVVPLMWVVQEQQIKIDDLEKRLKILEEKIK